jgi:hypothetical protein
MSFQKVILCRNQYDEFEIANLFHCAIVVVVPNPISRRDIRGYRVK